MALLDALFQQAEEAPDFLLLVETAKAHSVRIADRDHQSGVISNHFQVIEGIARPHDWRLADLFHNGYAVVRIHELFSDFETEFCCRQMKAPFG